MPDKSPVETARGFGPLIAMATLAIVVAGCAVNNSDITPGQPTPISGNTFVLSHSPGCFNGIPDTINFDSHGNDAPDGRTPTSIDCSKGQTKITQEDPAGTSLWAQDLVKSPETGNYSIEIEAKFTNTNNVGTFFCLLDETNPNPNTPSGVMLCVNEAGGVFYQAAAVDHFIPHFFSQTVNTANPVTLSIQNIGGRLTLKANGQDLGTLDARNLGIQAGGYDGIIVGQNGSRNSDSVILERVAQTAI